MIVQRGGSDGGKPAEPGIQTCSPVRLEAPVPALDPVFDADLPRSLQVEIRSEAGAVARRRADRYDLGSAGRKAQKNGVAGAN